MPAMPAGRLLLAALLLALAPAQDTRAAKTMGEGAEAVEEQAAATASKPAAGWRNMAAAATNTKSQPLWQRWEELYPSSKLSPVMGALKDHEYVYQIPASPTATLFVSPGCAHAATDWWPASPVCPSCLGLPEEVAQTQQALARGYAVLVMTSTNATGCMDWRGNHRAAVAITKSFRKEHGLEDLPLYGLGVSVGGSFVLKLPQHMKMDGLLSEVLGPRPEGWQPEKYPWGFPPTVFVSMDGDPSMAEKISQDSATLRRMGVPTETVRVPSRPVYPKFFSDRSPRIPPESSVRIVAALHQIGMLDEQGYVTQDPRHTRKPWVKELVALLPELSDAMTEDHSHVWEEMNLAYSSHEIISDFTTAAFVWLESGGTGDFVRLVDEHAPAGSGIVGDAAGAIQPPPAAVGPPPPPATVKVATGLARAAVQQASQTQPQHPTTQQQAVGGVQLGGGVPTAVAARVLGIPKERAQLVQQKAAQQKERLARPQQVPQRAQQQRGTQAQQAEQQQRGKQAQQAEQQQRGKQAQQAEQQRAGTAAGSSPGSEPLEAAPHAAEQPPAATAQADAGAASTPPDSAHSAATIVGGAAGTLVGAAILLALYRLSERKRAGFAALPTIVPHAPWEPALPVSQAAGKGALAPIPEGPGEP